jgi:hypothetical protein
MDVLERARRYLAKLPPSIQGSGGENALHNACFSTVAGFDILPDAAFPLIAEYNASAVPPWNDNALRLKLSGVNRFPGERGFLLGEESRERINRPTPAPTPQKPPRPRPETRKPTDAEMAEIARVRGVSVGAVALLVNHGILRVGVNRGLPAFFMVGPGIFQAKRMNGADWESEACGTFKVDTWKPEDGGEFPFGLSCGITAHTRDVIIAEGIVGLLELTEAVLRAEDDSGEAWEGVGVVGANSAASKLSAQQAAYLATRRVLILADAGDPGLKAAKAWRAAIKAAGGSARIRHFIVKDLRVALSASPACPNEITEFQPKHKNDNNNNKTQPSPTP